MLLIENSIILEYVAKLLGNLLPMVQKLATSSSKLRCFVKSLSAVAGQKYLFNVFYP
jgi:hypothetical protein